MTSNRAVVVNGKGGVEVFSEKTLPVPTLEPHDLLIEVRASASNPVDVKSRKGTAGPPTPDRVLGFDGAGVVRALGSAVVDGARFRVGDEVYFAGNLLRNGSYASLVAVDSRIVAHKPKSVDFAAASAIPLVALTVWEPLFENLRLPLDGSASDLVFLMVSGAGGVGSAALQIAKHVLKSKVIVATASRPESAEWCRRLGATHVIDHSKELKPQLDALGISGVDIAYCGVDLELQYDNIVGAMNLGGRIVAITVGDKASQIAVSKLFFPKRLTLSFEIMFGRPIMNVQPELQGAILERVAALVDAKQFQPIHHTVLHGLTLANVVKAQELQESGKAIGKIVITHS